MWKSGKIEIVNEGRAGELKVESAEAEEWNL